MRAATDVSYSKMVRKKRFTFLSCHARVHTQRTFARMRAFTLATCIRSQRTIARTHEHTHAFESNQIKSSYTLRCVCSSSPPLSMPTTIDGGENNPISVLLSVVPATHHHPTCMLTCALCIIYVIEAVPGFTLVSGSGGCAGRNEICSSSKPPCNTSANNLTKCAELCKSDSTCVSFEYEDTSGECQLSTTCTEDTTTPDWQTSWRLWVKETGTSPPPDTLSLCVCACPKHRVAADSNLY